MVTETVQSASRINSCAHEFPIFYRWASEIFTPEVMTEGFRLLGLAKNASLGNESSLRRVEYLESGLRNAQLGLEAQTAFGRRQRSGNKFPSAFQALKSFRAAHERQNIANMNFLAWAENLTWKAW